jgi:rhamnose transport system substrate-binding protein
MVDRNHVLALASLLALELAVFSLTGAQFLTAANAIEIARLSVELGLLSLALTPIIVTGGIDLSVGSLLALVAVTFGKLWRDGGLPVAWAAAAALLVGLAGGGLNALLIARFELPPLIVTLGTYSMFRGIAEGLTGGADNFSNFPPPFLFLGQGSLWGFVPPQTLIFAAAAAAFAWLLHRTVIGRGWYAIGHAPAAARYAAVPVARRLALAYLLSGAASAVAALIYVAHVGQAKSDAGAGYELLAITAVVLGGTSIFGGVGTIGGTLLGLFSIVVLEDGLRLSALPSELTGILTGVLLLAAIGATSLSARIPARFPIRRLAFAAALVALFAFGWLFVALPRDAAPGGRRLVIAVMPKAKGDPYFVSCRAGAEEAAQDLHANLIWDGPTSMDPARQNEVIEGWITRRVDAIAVAVANDVAISTVLRKARANHIPVVTWDADAQPGARDFFVDQATAQGIGFALADQAANLLGGHGSFAIITGALTAANQNQWIHYIRQRIAAKYPRVTLTAVRPSDDDRDKAFAETQTLIKVYPEVKAILAISAPSVPGAAEAVKQSGRADVKVTGLSLPNMCKPYVHAGIVASVVLWNTRDLGYLAVYAADSLARGTLKPGATRLRAGRLGVVRIQGSDIILGPPLVFTQSNIDRYDF